MKTLFKAKTTKENGKYYGVVEFYSTTVSDNIYINFPQETRAKALTIAKNRIKSMQLRGL